MKEVLLYDNYDSYGWYEDAKQCLIENGIEEPTDEQIWEEIADWERTGWEDMLYELKDKVDDCVLVSGTCGTWRGNFAGGKVMYSGDKPRWADSMLDWVLSECGKDCDYFKIGINESGNLFVQCTHHDGTNYYEIKNLTDKGMTAFSDWEYSTRFQKLSEQEMHEKLYNSDGYYTTKIKVA